ARQVLARLTMTGDAKGGVGRLAPDIGRCPRALPGARLDLVIGEDAEGRDDVLGEVLVLVVAPDHHDLRAEVVEDLPGVPEVAEEALAMPGRACRAAVVPVLAAHRLGPVARISVALRQAGVLKDAAKDARPVLVESGERR